jgi:hypothetical protein
MESKGLMIGNYLKTNKECQDDYVEVVEMCTDYVYAVDSAGLTHKKEDLEPITLTEEWAVKFGYECLVEMAIDIFDKSKYDIEITANDLEGLFVHECQNLYKALTNEDLKIK